MTTAITTGRRKKILSLVCPVLNEEDVIEIFLKAVEPWLDQSLALMGEGARYEIIFVDDGSTDRTASIIREIALTRPEVRLVRFSRNFGKEAALAAGLRHVMGDAAIPIDVDLQDPPEIIPQMVQKWLEGAEVVNAKRTDRLSDDWMKRKTAGLFYSMYNRAASMPIPANVGDFRLLDRPVIDAVNRFTEHNRFMKALFTWVGFTQTTVEFVRAPRVAGQTKFKFWKLWNFALDGITGTTTAPLRVWSYFGILIAAITFIVAVGIVIRTLLFGSDVPGYASMMVVILSLGSLNFISLGILGEYVGRISEEVRNRPLYIVRDDQDAPDA